MNAKISVFVIFAEVIIYFLLYNLHDCTFKKTINIILKEIYNDKEISTPLTELLFKKLISDFRKKATCFFNV